MAVAIYKEIYDFSDGYDKLQPYGGDYYTKVHGLYSGLGCYMRCNSGKNNLVLRALEWIYIDLEKCHLHQKPFRRL